MDYWFGAPFHAIGMLRAGLQKTAFAQDDTYAGMDVISGYTSSIKSSTPILFPGPGSTSYLTAYSGNESPDPIETCRKANPGADYSAPGLPLIAMLPTAPATSLTATLTTPSGAVLSSKSADLCIVDENTYVSTDTVYGPTGLQILSTDHAVLLVPRTRLVAGSYSARISQSKQADIAWSFVVDPTQPSTSPTTTAPITTAPTTTAPTTTATTTTAPTSTAPTSSGTTAPPVAESPEVSVSDVSCSYGTRATGSVSLAVTNPADGAGPATYSVAVGARAAVTGAVADGNDGNVRRDRPSGWFTRGHRRRVGRDIGDVPPRRADLPRLRRSYGSRSGNPPSTGFACGLDNSRNSHETQFRVLLGGDTTRHRVPAADVRKVGAPLHRVTLVRVYVGQHLVARARLHP